jgi:hypothetical protein
MGSAKPNPRAEGTQGHISTAECRVRRTWPFRRAQRTQVEAVNFFLRVIEQTSRWAYNVCILAGSLLIRMQTSSVCREKAFCLTWLRQKRFAAWAVEVEKSCRRSKEGSQNGRHLLVLRVGKREDPPIEAKDRNPGRSACTSHVLMYCRDVLLRGAEKRRSWRGSGMLTVVYLLVIFWSFLD